MRLVYITLFSLFVFFGFSSCNKEKSFEVGAPARGSLKSDNTGDCLPKTAVGAFIAGTALTDSNYLEIDVEVASPGSYSIRTDTLNGYSFSGIGNFDHTGTNRIRLAASGTPSIAGENRFSVIYDTSFCLVPVTVLPAGSNSGPAAFTLQGSGDTCMIAAVAGSYVQNAPLSASNTVSIKVNVTTTGTYTVTTNNVNEFQFAGSGTLATPGEQTIVLTATGTPATEGATVFTVSAGGTTCTFTVNVTPGGPPVNNGTLFPLTNNSYWTYTDASNAAGDSVVVTNRGTTSVAGNTYALFEVTDGAGQPLDTLYYRKSGNDYYSYLSVDEYSSLFLFDEEQKGDVLFLKENAAQGDTWNSAEYSGIYAGNAVKFQYVFTVTAVNTTATVDGKSYSDVYKVVARPQVSAGGLPYQPLGDEEEWWYAKGIGMIYQKGTYAGTTDHETILQHFQIF